MSLEYCLEIAGYKGLTAESGPTAVALAEKEPVDGALIDVHMPVMNGFDTCLRLQDHARSLGRELRVWFMMGAHSSALEPRSAELGAFGVLRKPFDWTAFLARLEHDFSSPVPLSPSRHDGGGRRSKRGCLAMNSQREEISHPAEASGRKRLRVLCAEDDDHLAWMLKMALERAGYSVERVADGQEAFDRIASNLDFFDLLVTDHEMPSVSGLALVGKLRNVSFSGRIIVHSSQLRARDAAAYRSFAVDHIFTKPVQLAELLRVIERMGGVAP